MTIRVDEGCSAIRSALSLIITSIVAGHFFLRSVWAKFGIVVVMVPLAIIDNAFRIVGLSLLANYVDKSFIMDGRLHDVGGYSCSVYRSLFSLFFISLLRRFEQRRVSIHLCAPRWDQTLQLPMSPFNSPRLFPLRLCETLSDVLIGYSAITTRR